MSKFNCSNSDQFKYLSPTNAADCWRELVRAANKSHPFKNDAPMNAVSPFPKHQDSIYHSTYSVPKRILRQRAQETSKIPSAGVPSFFKEAKRPELARFARDAERQQQISEHMRNECRSVRSTVSSESEISMHKLSTEPYRCLNYFVLYDRRTRVNKIDHDEQLDALADHYWQLIFVHP